MGQASQDAADVSPAPPQPASKHPVLSWSVILGVGTALWLVGTWASGGATPSPAWRLLTVFLATVLTLMLRPIPGGAAVLIGVIAVVLLGALPLKEALEGYSSPSVWLVLAAFFIARALIKTGLAKRIALAFICLLGRSPLGLGYALMATDTVLAGMIPSNAARVGGVVLPVTSGLAEGFASLPRGAAARVNTFLMVSLYQTDVLACALFLTGQSSNPLGARLAAELTGGQVVLGYGTWFLYALLPAAVTLLLAPWLVNCLCGPGQVDTSAVREKAREELALMGPLQRGERILIVLFFLVVGGWVVLGGNASVLAAFVGDAAAAAVIAQLGSPTSMVALIGVACLLLTGVLSWDDLVKETGAWDVFLWYGGLVMMGERLGETPLLRQFADAVAGALAGWPWLALFVVTLLVYFYAHYAFASITVHLVALYGAFVPVLLAVGAPPAVVALAFVYFANFSAGLTHYGTTPAPIIFGLGHVTQATWWRVGFLLSVVNVLVWLVLGLAWWKLLGLW